MKIKAPVVMLSLSLLAALACNPLSGVLGGGSEAGTVANLWSDVPPYPGAQKADLELPVFVRLAIEAATNAIMTEGGDKAGNLEFISFTTTDTPEAIMNYYSLDRMAAEGWEISDEQEVGCTIGSTAGEDFGGMCAFGKEGGEDMSALFLMIVPASEGGASNLFYVRIDADPDALATAAAQ